MSLTPLGVYAAQGAGGAPPATPPTVGGYTSGSSNSAAVSLTTPTCAVGDLLVAMWLVTGTAIASSPYDSTSSTGTVTGTVSATTTGAAVLMSFAPA